MTRHRPAQPDQGGPAHALPHPGYRPRPVSPLSPHSTVAYVRVCRHFPFLAGLEVKLYSDVAHHMPLVELAGRCHAELQEALPMTDVSRGGGGGEAGGGDEVAG